MPRPHGWCGDDGHHADPSEMQAMIEVMSRTCKMFPSMVPMCLQREVRLVWGTDGSSGTSGQVLTMDGSTELSKLRV